MSTRTDSARLAFLVAQGAFLILSTDDTWQVWRRSTQTGGLEVLSAFHEDYKDAIDEAMTAWETRLEDIGMKKVHPSREVRRYADAEHPAGFEDRDIIQAKAKRDWS